MRAEIAIMTCPRDPNYVVGLLEQLFQRTDMADVRARVVVDACENEGTFLGPWRNDPRVEKDFAMLPSTEPLGHPARILRTFKRCVTPLGRSIDGPLIVLQDDARVAPRWLDRALASEERVQAIAPAPASFFVTLWSQAKRVDGVTCVLPGDYYGAVGLLFPRRILPRLGEFLSTIDKNTPDDMALRAFAESGWVGIYDLHPSVVQHVGDHSSRHSRVMEFRSPTYKDEE